MRTPTLLVVFVLTACSSRPVDSDCDGMCDPAGPEFPGVGECKEGACTPTYGECATKDEISTCAEVCEAQGSTCVSNGCGGHTYRLYFDLSLCEDPERLGGLHEIECDEPIEWQVNAAAKCCCEQQ